MSRFFTGGSHPAIIEEAILKVNASITAMSNVSEGQPATEATLNFLHAFTNSLHRTGGPFKAMLLRGSRGPVDPVELDFLKILIAEVNDVDEKKTEHVSSLSYYRELLAMDDIDEGSMKILSKEDVSLLRSMSEVDADKVVSRLAKRRNLTDVVCIAKLLFGDKV